MNNLFNFPAVSIVIPLYNAEKYIGECLDSILAQTFQNFEVIVVDDCSTDNSAAIVKSYAEKFGERLIFTSTLKNSGNAGYTARNRGFAFSRGEYVYFVDADDFIANTALEQLYAAAKDFNADVVYTGARYRYFSEGKVVLEIDGYGMRRQSNKIEDTAELVIDNSNEVLQCLLIERGLFHTGWTKFGKRAFLLQNEITFYKTISGGDYIWTMELFALAKRFVRIPYAVYFYREDSLESMTRVNKPLEEQILK